MTRSSRKRWRLRKTIVSTAQPAHHCGPVGAAHRCRTEPTATGKSANRSATRSETAFRTSRPIRDTHAGTGGLRRVQIKRMQERSWRGSMGKAEPERDRSSARIAVRMQFRLLRSLHDARTHGHCRRTLLAFIAYATVSSIQARPTLLASPNFECFTSNLAARCCLRSRSA